MALVTEESYNFGSKCSSERRQPVTGKSDDWSGLPFADFYVGAAAKKVDNDCVEIGLSVHDGTYSFDFAVHRLCPAPGGTLGSALKAAALNSIVRFSDEHGGKFLGAGLTPSFVQHCPDIGAFLWREMDLIVFYPEVATTYTMTLRDDNDNDRLHTENYEIGVDEQADSAVRKMLVYFGPQKIPMLSIGFRNKVEVDTGGAIQLVYSIEDYRPTVSPETWKTVMHYTSILKHNRVKIAFFSATPQGGGVALMRHALIRFLKLLGINAEWYIPKPSPSVFRITKTNHNILQGVAHPDERFDKLKQDQFEDWIFFNAQRYWLSPGGPLAPGGADVVVIDDPQMPGLIPLIRTHRPEVKIIYRSHIEIRGDLVSQPGSPQEEVWKFLWERIKLADVFISHPVDRFVPSDVPVEMVALMPATTDWLDGLNKPMREWDLRYYHHMLRFLCHDRGMSHLAYPARDYIAQIARFDPSKGIPTVLAAYKKLRELYKTTIPSHDTPQLLICGHGAIDDPDGSIIFDQTVRQLDSKDFEEIKSDIIVIRLPPTDQLLDAIISTAKMVWQLSDREGFEVKVSEALHKGRPVIATRAGGIPLQIQDGKNGYLVDIGDGDAVAEKAFDLLNDEKKWKEMSEYAVNSVSDEVNTVGNAVCWMYLTQKLAKGEEVKGGGRWVVDIARKDAGVEWNTNETRLPRTRLRVGGGL